MPDAFDFFDSFLEPDEAPEPPVDRPGVPTPAQIGAALVDDRRAKESCRDAQPRRVAGESLADRVYARRVSAPGSRRRAKLFARLGIGDPWDQDSKERAIALGPVGTRLDEKRDVAPHAVPKAPGPAGPKLPDAPRAPAAKPPEPKPPPQSAQAPKPGAPKPGPQPAKPTGPIDRTPPPPKPPPRGPQPVVKSHTPAAGRSVPKPAPGAKPAQLGGRPPPVIAAPKPEEPKQGAGGRLRMAAQSLTNSGPRVMAIPKLEEKYDGPPDGAPDAPAAPKAAEPPPEVSRKPPGGDLGLDDLFGFAQNEGRMRIRRPKKGEDDPKSG